MEIPWNLHHLLKEVKKACYSFRREVLYTCSRVHVCKYLSDAVYIQNGMNKRDAL